MTEPKTSCPPWCGGAHNILYTCCDEPEPGDRDHFVEIGRLTGESHLVVGIAQPSPGEKVVELLHLDNTGRAIEELLAGEVYLTPGEALALGPLLAEAVKRLGMRP